MTYLASPDIDLQSECLRLNFLSVPFYADRSQRYLLSRSLRYTINYIVASQAFLEKIDQRTLAESFRVR